MVSGVSSTQEQFSVKAGKHTSSPKNRTVFLVLVFLPSSMIVAGHHGWRPTFPHTSAPRPAMATGAAGDFVVGFSFSEAAAAIAGSDPVGGTPALLSFTSGTCGHEVKAQRTSVSDVWLIVWGVGKARKRASLSHTHRTCERAGSPLPHRPSSSLLHRPSSTTCCPARGTRGRPSCCLRRGGLQAVDMPCCVTHAHDGHISLTLLPTLPLNTKLRVD